MAIPSDEFANGPKWDHAEQAKQWAHVENLMVRRADGQWEQIGGNLSPAEEAEVRRLLEGKR